MGKWLFLGVILGFLMGFAAAHALFLGWWTLVPWSIGGLALGYFCNKAGSAIATGLAYGFALVFVFLFRQYAGTAPLSRAVPFFGILSTFGAVCGVILCGAGVLLRRQRRLRHRNPS